MKEKYFKIRKTTEAICSPLQREDYVVQPVPDVSPPKWHLGHSTWFFETFVLKAFWPKYTPYHEEFGFIFNSYYETIGTRVLRVNRGNLSRPTVDKVYAYRGYVDTLMGNFFQTTEFEEKREEIAPILELGLQHEQQHQELLHYDIKYILGTNPLFPVYGDSPEAALKTPLGKGDFITVPSGNYEIGHQENSFCFDNELGAHQIYLQEFQISDTLVTNKEYLEFINDGGYETFNYWLAEGWDWVKQHEKHTPFYWHKINDTWQEYQLDGLQAIDLNAPVKHINYFEADAFARWKGMRLPTEFEWEVASRQFEHGLLWEWTASAYLPYPGFKIAEGAIGEYNGKFMVNQMVLRGGSLASSENHVRKTYRNFFHPHLQWMFSGIRLAK